MNSRAPTLVTLPPELVDEILFHLTYPELKVANLVSKLLWKHASARLWSRLFSVDPLFRLITGRSVLPGKRARPASWERTALIRRLPKTLDSTTWKRFEKYRNFVRILYIGRCVLPLSLYAALWEKKQEQALLPRLRALLVSPTENQEWQWSPCANDVEDILLLFLSSSVTRFATSCDQHAIVPTKILESAPNMEELRLGASGLMITRTECSPARKNAEYDWQTDPNNKGVYIQKDVSDWPQAVANLFPQWPLLSCLTVNGYFICTLQVLENIARIPTLTTLRICQPEIDFWGDLGNDPIFFTRLAELSLWRATAEHAMQVFRCAPLIRGIKRLAWDITRVFRSSAAKRSEYAAQCLAALEEIVPRATCLAQIYISDLATMPPVQPVSRANLVHIPLWSCIKAVQLFAPLRLRRLHVDADLHFLEYRAAPMKALLSLGPQLMHLSMQGVVVPTQAFKFVARIYPRLSYLRCQMDMAHIDVDFLEGLVPSPNTHQRDKSHIITLCLAVSTKCFPKVKIMENRTDLDSPQLTHAWCAQTIILNRDMNVEQSKHALRTMKKMQKILQSMAERWARDHTVDSEAEGLHVEDRVLNASDGNLNKEREFIFVDDSDNEGVEEVVTVRGGDINVQHEFIVIDDSGDEDVDTGTG